MLRLRWALALCVVALFASSSALALNVDLTSLFPGDFFVFTGGTATNPTPNTLIVNIGNGHSYTITAYYWDVTLNGGLGAWTGNGVNIVGRNESGAGEISPDHGIGICNPLERAATGGVCSRDGNFNEISDRQAPELFQISKDFNEDWTGLGLSSLDNNLDEAPPPPAHNERGQIFGSNLSIGSVPMIITNTASTSLLCDFEVNIGVHGSPCQLLPNAQANEPDVKFNNPSDASFLYLQAYNPDDPTFLNNDYLLRSLPGDPTPDVPEPGSLSLFATGLAAASFAIRRKLRG